MHTIINLCFLCTKEFNCVLADERIVSQVEYLLPEITIIKLGIPLRICSVCDGALCAFSKFKQSSVESSRRLEARIKGTQGPSLHTGSPPAVDDSETSDVKLEKMEEIFIKEEYVEQTPLDTQMLTNRVFLDPIALLETVITEPHNQLHKDRVSQNIHLHTDTNADNIEEISIKKAQIEEAPQDKVFYNNLLKENDDTNRQPEHRTEVKSSTLNTSDEVWKGSSADAEKDFQCKICEKSFNRKDYLTNHMKMHNGVKDFHCEICAKSFTRKYYLTTHMTIHSGVKDFKCEICEKSFNRKDYLTTHMKVHLGVKDFYCEICAKSFIRKDHLTTHKKIHFGVRDFQCKICEKSFQRKDILMSHIKIHSGVKDFLCEICEKSFTQKSTLISHMKIHAGVKDFQCDICEKSFRFRSNLNSHIKIHSKAKDF